MSNINENEVIDFALNFFTFNSFSKCPIKEINEKFNLTRLDIIFINNCFEIAELKGLIIFSGNSNLSAKLTKIGLSIIENGGWINYLEREAQKDKLKKDIDEAELENLKTNTEINKWLIKTKWLPHIISIFSLITTIIFGIITIKNDEELEKLKINKQKIEHKKNSSIIKK